MANSSHPTSQIDQNHLAEQRKLENQQQQQQRCVCQENFSHDEHQKSPELFSPVCQQMVNTGFGYIALVYAFAFGLCGILSTAASFRGLVIAAQSNALANTANQLTLLQTCVSNSVCCLKKTLLSLSIFICMCIYAANMFVTSRHLMKPSARG